MNVRSLVPLKPSAAITGVLDHTNNNANAVAEAQNGLEAVEKSARFQPTVVLMDIRMPELDGLEATRRVLAPIRAPRS